MKKLLFACAASAVILISYVGAAFAAQPVHPGCFGTDRAAWLTTNSGAEWGAIAPTRAGDNGTINQDYKTLCGGNPVQ